MSEKYVARARRCDGWWALEVDVPGTGRTLATQVRRLDQAPAMVADLLATFFDRGREEFAIQVVPLLDDEIRSEIEDARNKRARIEETIREAGEASRKAARHLQSQGLTARDIAVLLGVTHQRVSQLLTS
jgi:predicted XRE-type DNA-binding protein